MKLLLALLMVFLFLNISLFGQTVTGSGYPGYLPKFSGTSVVTSSLIFDNGTNVGIGTTTPAYKLDVKGTANFSTDILVKGINIGSGTGTGSNNYTNTIFGTNAGSNLTNASGNTFTGYRSAVSNTTGSNNTFNGLWTGYSNTTGTQNSFVGQSAGFSNTTGFQNNFIGQSAGYNNTTANNNSFFGAMTGYENTIGSNNSYYGANTGRNITTGSNNTLVGGNITTLAPYTSNNIVIADGSGNRRINVDSNGLVGLGVLIPTANLEIAGSWASGLRVGVTSNRANTSTQLASTLAVIGNDNMATTFNGAVAWDFYNNGNNASWSGALLKHIGTGVTGMLFGLPAANQGQLLFQNVGNAVIGTNGSNLFISPNAQLSTTFFTNGNVGIGTSIATSYKLAVNGSAIFTKAVVKLYSNWPDYVFAPLYQLPLITEVEAYIKKHQHLEGMPTSAEVEKEGIDLGSNQALLLKKVEELTLYVIELNKKVDAISKENELLKKGANSINP